MPDMRCYRVGRNSMSMYGNFGGTETQRPWGIGKSWEFFLPIFLCVSVLWRPSVALFFFLGGGNAVALRIDSCAYLYCGPVNKNPPP